MLLRRLLHRLRLPLDSQKLRLLAASASLGDSDEAARAYLEEFFGVERTSFAILAGVPREFDPRANPALPEEALAVLAAAGEAILSGEADEDDAVEAIADSPSAFAREHRLAARLAEASRDGRGAVSPKPAGDIAAALAPTEPVDRGRAVLAGLLSVLAAIPAAETADDLHLPVRAHLFFRTIPGWWACARSDCPAVPEEFRAPTRTVGRLYAQPTIRCECGARCLDL